MAHSAVATAFPQKFFVWNRDLKCLGFKAQKMDASEREQYRAATHGDREAFEMIIRTRAELIFRGAHAARVQLSAARREQRHRCGPQR